MDGLIGFPYAGRLPVAEVVSRQLIHGVFILRDREALGFGRGASSYSAWVRAFNALVRSGLAREIWLGRPLIRLTRLLSRRPNSEETVDLPFVHACENGTDSLVSPYKADSAHVPGCPSG